MMNTQLAKDLNLFRLLRDRGGNFGIITALLLPVALGAGGVAIDLANIAMSQRQLQEASDAAALAAASALASGKVANTTEAQALAKDFVAGQMANYLSGNEAAASSIRDATSVDIKTTTTGTNGKTYSITVNASYPMQVSPFLRVFGYNTVDIASRSGTLSDNGQGSESMQNALSMYLVLDRSGSMSWITDEKKLDSRGRETSCPNYTEENWSKYPKLASSTPCYIKKIEALKAAAGSLFAQLDAANTTNYLVRTGAVSYTHEMQSPKNLDWGTAGAKSYVQALPDLPTGGTDSSNAMSTAYAKLTDPSEKIAQEGKGNGKFDKYIVFMTDGKNTGNSASHRPDLDTATLKTCKSARDAGITIYSVAFMAPQEGQDLLRKCADNAANYYEADDMAALISAFKSIGQKAAQQTIRLTQ
ncbi:MULTISPECIES: VWA domain-containing protein [unclassified Sinorhizobium]|uniref:vWA domain-containing protein n=1 Tax=unclassified Sinorhizobium TaxID=2613772 RepID=UPI0035238531